MNKSVLGYGSGRKPPQGHTGSPSMFSSASSSAAEVSYIMQDQPMSDNFQAYLNRVRQQIGSSTGTTAKSFSPGNDTTSTAVSSSGSTTTNNMIPSSTTVATGIATNGSRYGGTDSSLILSPVSYP